VAGAPVLKLAPHREFEARGPSRFLGALAKPQSLLSRQMRGTCSAVEKQRGMQAARSLWALVQGDPHFMRRLNGWLTVFWIVMIPSSYALGWLHSVTYVSALSLWALVSGHWSTWQAARVEVHQQEQIEKEEENPVEERVVEKIVEETEVEKE
jgi:hypothetical protein